MEQYFDSYREAYEAAIGAITELREAAQEVIDRMEDVISSCETIEEAL